MDKGAARGASGKLVVGLGNIGPQYADTRHNIGFLLLDYWAKDLGLIFRDWNHIAAVCKIGNVILAKPSLYMNLSGSVVQRLMQFYKIQSHDIIVVHDDIDLPPMEIRVKLGGSSAGHNGIKSIDQHISNTYHRVRVGIGRPDDKEQVTNYVLGKLSPSEKAALLRNYEIIKEAIEKLL